MATTPKELWGTETRKAVENFPVSGEPIPVPVARWLGRIKAAAARANAELGELDSDVAGYEGKITLITIGFGEAAIAANNAIARIRGEKVQPKYSTD